jgi:hypothetical protein
VCVDSLRALNVNSFLFVSVCPVCQSSLASLSSIATRSHHIGQPPAAYNTAVHLPPSARQPISYFAPPRDEETRSLRVAEMIPSENKASSAPPAQPSRPTELRLHLTFCASEVSGLCALNASCLVSCGGKSVKCTQFVDAAETLCCVCVFPIATGRLSVASGGWNGYIKV